MKTKMMHLFLLIACFNLTARAQSVNLENSETLPGDLTIDKSTPQTYKMITDYFDYDLNADFIRKARIEGNFTCNLPNDTVKWNNVYIAGSNQLNGPFLKGEKQMAFENFKYVQSAETVEEKFFSKFNNIDFRLKNLVWDMLGFEVFAYSHWDSLKLNKVFDANTVNGEVNLSNEGVFENKEIQLTWIGITKINNEVCAIIRYSQMNGKLNLELGNMSMKGRSHYWGEVYVSLEDKQIEYATLKEDVLTDVYLKEQNNRFQGYTVRNITLEKVVNHADTK